MKRFAYAIRNVVDMQLRVDAHCGVYVVFFLSLSSLSEHIGWYLTKLNMVFTTISILHVNPKCVCVCFFQRNTR